MKGQCPRATHRRNFIESLLGIKISPAGCVEGGRGGKQKQEIKQGKARAGSREDRVGL